MCWRSLQAVFYSVYNDLLCVYNMHQRVILLLTAIYFSQCNGECDCGVFNKKHVSPASTNAKIYKGSNSPNNLRYPWYV